MMSLYLFRHRVTVDYELFISILDFFCLFDEYCG